MRRDIDINFNHKEEDKRCKIIDDVLEKSLVQRLVKDVLENILEDEMEEYLVRDKY